MGDANSLLVGSSGGGSDATGLAWFAATGTTAPADATTALNAGFKDAGLISEDGLSISFSESSKKIKAYGSQATQRTVVTDQEFSFKIRFIETNEISQAVFWRKAIGAIVPTVSTGTFNVTGGTYARQLYAAVFEVVDVTNGTNHLRFYAPSCEVTARDDVSISNGNEIGWGVTVTAYPVAGVALQMFVASPNLG